MVKSFAVSIVEASLPVDSASMDWPAASFRVGLPLKMRLWRKPEETIVTCRPIIWLSCDD